MILHKYNEKYCLIEIEKADWETNKDELLNTIKKYKGRFLADIKKWMFPIENIEKLRSIEREYMTIRITKEDVDIDEHFPR